MDEAGFNANLIRGQRWPRKDQQSVVTTRYKRAMSLSILAGIPYHVFENISAKVVEGGTTGAKLKDYVQVIIKNLHKHKAGPYFFLIHNASIHEAEVAKDVFKSSQNSICFLPPYFPFLNPVEERFSKQKALVKRKLGLTQSELKIHIKDSTNEITTKLQQMGRAQYGLFRSLH